GGIDLSEKYQCFHRGIKIIGGLKRLRGGGECFVWRDTRERQGGGLAVCRVAEELRQYINIFNGCVERLKGCNGCRDDGTVAIDMVRELQRGVGADQAGQEAEGGNRDDGIC